MLDLSVSSLTKFPVKELALVPRAKKLDFSRNRLTSLPDNLSDLKHIVELDLSQNQLTALPDGFGVLCNLQKLDLFKNQLTTLPLSFAQLKKLKWLDLKGNKLELKLQEAAGTCLDDAECRACATNVVAFMRAQASEAERIKQKRLAEEREAQRKFEEEEKEKKKEAQKLKAELRKRRQLEEEERKARQKEEDDKIRQQDAVEPRSDETERDTTGAGASNKWKCCFGIGLVLILIGVVLALMLIYCDNLYSRDTCHNMRKLVLREYQLLKQRLLSKS